MTIRRKVLVLYLLTAFCVLGLLLAAAREILMERFAQLERDQVRTDMDRVLNGIDNTLEGIQATAKDYGNWDDTYAYLAEPSQTYIKTNFVEATFANLKLEVVALADSNGSVVFSQGYDTEKKELVPVTQANLDLFAANGFFGPELMVGPPQGRRGLLQTAEGPLLVVAKPVLTSEEKGPARGVLVMGRLLDADEVRRLAELTLLDVTLLGLSDSPIALSQIERGLRSPAMQAPVAVHAVSGGNIEGLALVHDMQNQPLGVLRLVMDRQLYDKGVTATLLFLAILMLGGVFFAVVFGVILERTVLGRLSRLSTEVAPIGANKELSLRVKVEGSDEISALESSINGMLDGLERSDQENRAISVELQTAKEAAEAASTAKGRFLATMSHEIRTPMNAVLGLTELALESAPPAQLASYLVDIRNASQHLMTLIEGVLDFSRIEAGRLELESAPVSLAGVAGEVESLFRGAAKAKNLFFTVRVAGDLPEWVMGDSLRLGQVLTNLVGNAVKFTARGAVSLDVESCGQRVCFSVRDTGIGIEPNAREMIFQPFVQADNSTTRTFGGTGLGLAICRELVQHMGGELGFTSEPGKGSTFSFSLPLTLAQAPDQHGPSGSEVVDLAGALVLVAEDNVFNRRVVQEMLTLSGVEAVMAVNGKEAAMAVLGTDFDAVLMDMHMPELDGLEATRLIRGYAGPDVLPIIAMTAAALPGDRQSCMDAGMNDYVVKPVSRQTLHDVLGRWIRRKPRNQAGARAVLAFSRPVSVPAMLSGLEGIDLSKAFSLYDGRADLLDRILSRFPEDFQDTPARIAEALDADDLEGAMLLAHSLKGAAGNIAADALQRAAQDVEGACMQGLVTDARLGLATLEPILKGLSASIAVAIRNGGLTAGAAQTSATIPTEG